MIFQDFLLSQGQDYLKKNPLNQLQNKHPFFIFSLNDLIRENKLIGSNDKMEIILEFIIDKMQGLYHMVFKDDKIVYEELKFPHLKRKVTFFSINIHHDSCYLNPNIFFSKKYYFQAKELVKKFFGNHSFFSILNREIYTKNVQFLKESLHEKLINILDKFNNIIIYQNEVTPKMFKMKNEEYLPFLFEGAININSIDKIYSTEALLNEYLNPLFSDIKGGFYYQEKNGNLINYKLVIRKMVAGKIREIPYDFEATGIRKMLSLIPLLHFAIKGKTVILDEADNDFHELLFEHIIKGIKEKVCGQLIVTTHNTKLLDVLYPYEIYIIKTDIDGRSEVFCLDEFKGDFKNIREKYLKGLYYGIPIL
jgi:hypothetical protein